MTRAGAGIAAAVAVILLSCSGLVRLLSGGGASAGCTGPAAAVGSLELTSGRSPAARASPIGRWNAGQAANAAVIVAVGQRMHIPVRGQVIAVATAMQESSLMNLTGGDRDSVGLFQQRPSQGWGTPAQLQDPQYAATRFYTTLVTVAGWQTMPLTEAAQHVQVSAFPGAYARWEPDATLLVGAVTGTDLTCSSVGVAEPAPRNPDGSWPREHCVIRPDPSTGYGCITPRLLHLIRQADAAGFPEPGCYRVDDHGEHPQGRACDWMMTSGGEASGAEKARGDAMAAWAVTNADRLGIAYVIWFRMIWTGEQGWRGYNNPYGGDDPSGWHTNHVHISVH